MEKRHNGHGGVAAHRERFKRLDVFGAEPHRYEVHIKLENYAQPSIVSSVYVADSVAATRAYGRARDYCRALSAAVPGDRYRVEVFMGSNGCGKLIKRSRLITEIRGCS